MVFKRISDKRMITLLTWVCTVIYFMAYMTRLNYAAVVAEIANSTGIAKDILAFPVTGLFITYGLGQLISGWLGDRIAPKRLMFTGLGISTLMNLLLPFGSSPAFMTVVWCINGVGQSMIWPPMVKILSGYLSGEGYVKATFTIILGSTCGTIGVYLLAAICTAAFTWQTLFYICTAFGVIGLLICYFGIGKVERFSRENGVEVSEISDNDIRPLGGYVKIDGKIVALIITIMAAIVLQGSLRDGVTTWMPTYVSETFKLGSSSSILSGVILPIFTFLCLMGEKAIFPRFIKNELNFAGIIFACGAVFALILSIFPTANPIISIGCSALLVACMHGVNQLLISLVPRHFNKTGKISTISGILNFATYVGAALSTYCFAALANGSDWRPVIVLWVFITVIGAAVCFALVKPWDRFTKL